MQNHSIRNSLLFSGVDKSYIEEFLTTFSRALYLNKGEILCRQYDIGDSMYLLESGQLEILINDLDSDVSSSVVISTIESGSVIGEMCVFGQKTRSATIRVATDAKLLIIEGEQFRKRVEAHEVGALKISYNIAKLLSQHLVKANELISLLYKKIDKGEAKSELEFYRQRFFDESLFN